MKFMIGAADLQVGKGVLRSLSWCDTRDDFNATRRNTFSDSRIDREQDQFISFNGPSTDPVVLAIMDNFKANHHHPSHRYLTQSNN